MRRNTILKEKVGHDLQESMKEYISNKSYRPIRLLFLWMCWKLTNKFPSPGGEWILPGVILQ